MLLVAFRVMPNSLVAQDKILEIVIIGISMDK